MFHTAISTISKKKKTIMRYDTLLPAKPRWNIKNYASVRIHNTFTEVLYLWNLNIKSPPDVQQDPSKMPSIVKGLIRRQKLFSHGQSTDKFTEVRE